MLKSELAAADYRRHAAASLKAADEARLMQVERLLRATAERWTLLAEMEDRRTEHSRHVALVVAARRLAEAAACG